MTRAGYKNSKYLSKEAGKVKKAKEKRRNSQQSNENVWLYVKIKFVKSTKIAT